MRRVLCVCVRYAVFGCAYRNKTKQDQKAVVACCFVTLWATCFEAVQCRVRQWLANVDRDEVPRWTTVTPVFFFCLVLSCRLRFGAFRISCGACFRLTRECPLCPDIVRTVDAPTLKFQLSGDSVEGDGAGMGRGEYQAAVETRPNVGAEVGRQGGWLNDGPPPLNGETRNGAGVPWGTNGEASPKKRGGVFRRLFGRRD